MSGPGWPAWVTGAVVAGLAAGAALPAYGYWTASASSTVTAAAQTLRPAEIRFTATATAVTVTVDPPALGPAPTSYAVTRSTGDVTAFQCVLTAPGECPDDLVGAPGQAVHYTVTTRLGDHWVQVSTLDAATLPLAPAAARAPALLSAAPAPTRQAVLGTLDSPTPTPPAPR